MNFSKILKSLRKEYNLTQKELGEIIGKSNRVISYYELLYDSFVGYGFIPTADELGEKVDI